MSALSKFAASAATAIALMGSYAMSNDAIANDPRHGNQGHNPADPGTSIGISNNNANQNNNNNTNINDNNAYGGAGGRGGAGGKGGTGGTGNADAASGGNNFTVNNGNNYPPIGNAPAVFSYANGRCQYGWGGSIGVPFAAAGLSMTNIDHKCSDTLNAMEGLRAAYAAGDNAGVGVFYNQLKAVDPRFADSINGAVRAVLQCPAIMKVSGVFAAADPYIMDARGCGIVASMAAPPVVIEKKVYVTVPAKPAAPACPGTTINNVFQCPANQPK